MDVILIWCILLSIISKISFSKNLEDDFDIFDLLSEVIQVEVVNTDDIHQLQVSSSQNYTVDECIQATNNLTSDLFKWPNNLIMSYSWKDVDDLGNYFACTHDLQGIAQYYSLNVNITSIPFYFRSGMCMPIQCTQIMLDEVAIRLNNVFADLLMFLSKFEELELIAKYNIRFGYNFVQPREALNNIRQGKMVPAILIALLFLGFLVHKYVTLFLETKDEYIKSTPKFLCK